MSQKNSKHKFTQNRDRLNTERLSTDELIDQIVNRVEENPKLNNLIEAYIGFRPTQDASTVLINIIEQGLDGTTGETQIVFSEILKIVREQDPTLSSQIKLHEFSYKNIKKAEKFETKAEKLTNQQTKHQRKTPTKNRKYRPHYETVEKKDKETGETVLIEKKKFTETTKLKRGERNTRQILLYQSLHQPSKFMTDDFKEESMQEGNEGIQMSQGLATKLHHKVTKPIIRKHTVFGFDYHQTKAMNLESKITKTLAKSDYRKTLANMGESLSSNKVKQAFQKRQMKRRIYREHGLANMSLRGRVSGGFKNLFKSINPFNNLKNKASEIWGIVTAVLGSFQFLLTAGGFMLIILIPAIAIINMFSIFFGFDSGSDSDMEITRMTEVYQEAVVDVQKEMLDAETSGKYFKASSRYDEVRIEGEWKIPAQESAKRQLQAISYLTAYYGDDLTYKKGEDLLKGAVKDTFSIKERYQNEPKKICWFESVTEEKYDETTEVIIIETKEVEKCRQEDNWVLYISLERKDFEEYILKNLKTLENSKQELALVQYDSHQELYGFGQIYGNPLGEVDWRTKITSTYGHRVMSDIKLNNKEKHNALDFGLPIGTPLYAIADGTVQITVSEGYGVLATLYPDDDKDIKILYAHLKEGHVKSGTKVKKGDLIAYSGNSGRSTGPHLHLEIRNKKERYNPLFLIDLSS